MVLQFWRAVPERYNPNTGSKSYDEAAPPVIGWADGASPCAERLASLDTTGLAVQRGETPAPNAAALHRRRFPMMVALRMAGRRPQHGR